MECCVYMLQAILFWSPLSLYWFLIIMVLLCCLLGYSGKLSPYRLPLSPSDPLEYHTQNANTWQIVHISIFYLPDKATANVSDRYLHWLFTLYSVLLNRDVVNPSNFHCHGHDIVICHIHPLVVSHVGWFLKWLYLTDDLFCKSRSS